MFVNGSSASNASDYAAIVDGVWDSATVQAAFGDNFAAAKLPTFTVDGTSYQLSGFGGFKMLGVKPQIDEAKLAACDALALYLTGEAVQAARFEQSGWGPSNLKAQQMDAVKADPLFPRWPRSWPSQFPRASTPVITGLPPPGLGDDVIAGKLNDLTDAQLLERLTQFQDVLISLVTK